jgi:hypothetical protein
MTPKKPGSPDGIVCSRCGKDKTPHHFFKFIGKFDRAFFVSGIPSKSDVCWDCLGDMKCIECGEVYPSTEFKVNGRVCRNCKRARLDRLRNGSAHFIMPTNTNAAVEEVV